jgi:hypothetical protein
MNDLIKLYNHLIDISAQFLKELRKDKVDVIKAITESPDKTVKQLQESVNSQTANSLKLQRSIENLEKSAIESLDKLNNTISNQKNPLDSVDFAGIKDNILGSLKSITETIKSEVGKMDKQVVIKNDLSTLYGLFKQNKEVKDVVRAIEMLDKSIRSIKQDVIVNSPEEVRVKFDELFKFFKGKLDNVFKTKLSDHEITNENPIPVVLTFKNKNYSANTDGANIGGWGVSAVKVWDKTSTPINPATEETLKALQGLQIPVYDTEIVDETDPTSIVITYKKNGATVATKNITIVGAVTTTTLTL